MEIVPLKKICSTLGRKKHENIVGFSCFHLTFFVLFWVKKKPENPKTRKHENMKTQKPTHSV